MLQLSSRSRSLLKPQFVCISCRTLRQDSSAIPLAAGFATCSTSSSRPIPKTVRHYSTAAATATSTPDTTTATSTPSGAEPNPKKRAKRAKRAKKVKKQDGTTPATTKEAETKAKGGRQKAQNSVSGPKPKHETNNEQDGTTPSTTKAAGTKGGNVRKEGKKSPGPILRKVRSTATIVRKFRTGGKLDYMEHSNMRQPIQATLEAIDLQAAEKGVEREKVQLWKATLDVLRDIEATSRVAATPSSGTSTAATGTADGRISRQSSLLDGALRILTKVIKQESSSFDISTETKKQDPRAVQPRVKQDPNALQPWKPKDGSTIGTALASKFDLGAVPQRLHSVPTLSYGLERVLFNPGVYTLQDPRSRVYNFDPYLADIMPVNEFDFNAIQEFTTSSKDTTLTSMAAKLEKKYTGSTSSMTSILSHFHYQLSSWRPINISQLSRTFEPESTNFVRLYRAPAAGFLHYKDGTYAIDSDKEFDNANILSMMGKSMEKLLTLPKTDFEKYRKTTPEQLSEEERNAPEAYHYTSLGDFLMRSQLDAHDPRLPGTGMFDLKTRAVISIRMNAQAVKKGMGYEITRRFGEWQSFEREYYDMMRAAFMKYSLQVRMGRMDGIFVAYHNVRRIFGFQYISLPEMDEAIHGYTNNGTALGDSEFKLSLAILNKILDKATAKYPGRSLRLHVETRPSIPPFMYIFAEPVTPKAIEEIQGRNRTAIKEFERVMMEVGVDGVEGALNDNSAQEVVEEEDNLNPEEVDLALGGTTGTPAKTISAQPEEGELLGMVLRTRNKVNGKYVTRPDKLTEKEPEWEVEYEIEELQTARAWELYRNCKRRRESVFDYNGKEAWEAAFGGKLKFYSQLGREHRAREEKRAERHPQAIVLGEKTKKW
ncbi:mitochondrial protein Pet127-domain-containing protein [Podospora didyma]|uniref:Mitochondrial protein Pet127-domain-containing protein n=1 Tax=Podospora didyma TaxID=330526 RepID=A0AAE0NCG2_9PEZI|nr:mitochondrial protein Pet127-domain-containing protein [Podospora didyma]